MALTTLIDDILSRLHDDETLFSRAEIVRWLSAGYRWLTSRAKHAKTFSAFDMPPRHTRAITFDWEKNRGTGTWRKWTYTSTQGTECTFLWEVQRAAGGAPENATASVTQLWELAYVGGSVDTHYRFMLPKQDAGLIRAWHDHEFIGPTTVKFLDSQETQWWSIGGEPFAWAQILGDEHTFEIYELQSSYFQSFDYSISDVGVARAWIDSGSDDTFSPESANCSWDYAYAWNGEPGVSVNGPFSGIGRRFTFGPNVDGNYYTFDWEGDAHPAQNESAAVTFHWETDKCLELGLLRVASSADRQYWPSYQWSVLGAMRKAGKSEDAILLYHNVYAEDITSEFATLDMIPDQLRKYLVYYALYILFNRQGEGYDPAMAGHYQLRASRGITALRRLGMIQSADESYVRGGGRRGVREPPLPQLPPNYPRAPWGR